MYFSRSSLQFYDKPVFEDCVEVTNEVHNDILEKRRAGYVISADSQGYPVATPPTPPAPPSGTDVFESRLTILNAEYTEAVELMHSTYPQAETDTWAVQCDEAVLYDTWRKRVAAEGAAAVGPRPATPFLDALSGSRDQLSVGAGYDDLVDRILHNTSIYTPAIGYLTAARHAAEFALRVALATGTNADIEAVTWSFAVQLSSEPTVVQQQPPAEA